MPKIDIYTQKKHIKEFSENRHLYETYAEILSEILNRVKSIYSPMGIVQVRPKSISSFSEKLIRKDKYIKPLEEITDLCGARVITHFSSEVEKICEFIRNEFEVDELNSLDVTSRLNVGEFGYRSIHYIATPYKTKILGVEIPPEIRTLKAEIQVRTFIEHIWADIFHDRIYKAPIQIPEEWKRESARLAAILENADNAFKQMSDTIDQVTINYIPTPNPTKAKNEEEILKTLIDLNNEMPAKSAEDRLKFAQLAIIKGNWDAAVEILSPLIDDTPQARILYEYGFCLCYQNKIDPSSPNFKAGIVFIESAIQKLNEDNKQDLAKAYYYLGKVSLVADKYPSEVIKCFVEAQNLVPDNPYYYVRFLIEDVFRSSEKISVDIDLFSSRLRSCIAQCEDHINIGIEILQALFTIAKSYFLLNEIHKCLNTLIKVVDYIIKDKVVFSKDLLEDELHDYFLIKPVNREQSQFILGLLHLVIWIKFKSSDSENFLQQFHTSDKKFADNILIIAGRSDKFELYEIKKYEVYVKEALQSFEGTVISGGTQSGIPGLVGAEAAILQANGNKKFTLFGYLPKELPNGSEKSNNYDFPIKSPTKEFSFCEVLNYWIDIKFSGVDSEKIILMGYDGGGISELEYKMALALGIKVAVLKNAKGAAGALILDNYWKQNSNLMILPEDPLTVWALINQNKPSSLFDEEIEKLAIGFHGYYRELQMNWFDPDSDNINQYKAIMDWDKLDPILKISNFKQAQFVEHLLSRAGLKIQKSAHPEEYLFSSNKNLDLTELAKLEHARWNAERLTSGWKPGNKKDIKNKISPYIKPWELLDEITKKFDFNAIQKIPELLKEIRYEIVEK